MSAPERPGGDRRRRRIHPGRGAQAVVWRDPARVVATRPNGMSNRVVQTCPRPLHRGLWCS